MPQVSLITNQQSPADPVECRNQLSGNLAEWLNKPESFCMVYTQFAAGLSFGGSEDPAATVELSSLGLPEDQLPVLTRFMGEYLKSALGIEPARMYIRFNSPPRSHWGWNGKIFG